MSKEAIVQKIIADAERRKQSTIAEAQAQADAILSECETFCDDYRNRNSQKIDEVVAEIAKRGKTVADLDARKVQLSAKSRVLEMTFARVNDKLKALDKDAYKALILGMLQNAEDGDTVTISARDKDVITKEMIASISKSRGITLTLCKEFGEFDGGILLSQNGIDKNLTFEVETAILRDEQESEVIKELM